MQRLDRPSEGLQVLIFRHGEGGQLTVGSHLGRLEGGAEDLDAAGRRGDGDLARRAADVAGQDDGQGVAAADASRGAADADGRHRRVDGHGVGIDLGDLAADERHDAGHQGNSHGARLRPRIVDHLVEDQAAALVEGEDAVVGQDDADGRILAGFDDVALEHRVALLDGDLGAVGASHLDTTLDGFDGADGFGAGHVRRLGILSGRRRPGQLGGQFGGNNRAAPGHQVGRVFQVEEIADEDFASIRADQQKIGAGADEIGLQQPSFRRHHQGFARHRLENLYPPTVRRQGSRRGGVLMSLVIHFLEAFPVIPCSLMEPLPESPAPPSTTPVLSTPTKEHLGVVLLKSIQQTNKTLLGRACHKLELFKKRLVLH